MFHRTNCDAGPKEEPVACPVRPQLTDEQWLLICDLFPIPKPDPRGGRPRVDSRQCLEGVLWVLRSGARWKDLPRSFPSYATCWRRFAQWSLDGVWDRAWSRLLSQLDQQGDIDWVEGFADGTFASAKKGATALVQRSEVKAPSSWCLSTDKVSL